MKRVFLIGTLTVIALYFFAGAASALPIPIRSIATPIKSFADSGNVLEALLGWNNLSGIRHTGSVLRQNPGHVAIGGAKYWYADHERDLGFLNKQEFIPLDGLGQGVDASSAGGFNVSDQDILPLEQKEYSSGMTWFANSFANPANIGAMLATLAEGSNEIGHISIVAWEDLTIQVDWSYTDDFLGLFGESSDNLVPEPAVMLLFGIGLIGLVALGRKKLLKE